ncbi:hypothetical protein FQN50_009093 [Emmonsiellopsis sp. PD_5]|nr:hypothetical protein FQN50_009093 [Emmonsiellopsis sp. PD_5]
MTASKPRAKSKSKPGLLSHGRPPTSKPTASLSAKATRTLIRSHHQLHKARARAVADGDEALIAQLDAQIAARGGLESYQLASKKGQSKERGGDSSKVLVEWLGDALRVVKGGLDSNQGGRLRLLEVGALSTKNACSTIGALDVTRIDLHSQEKGILQQDFMERPLPLPGAEAERFHVISLSLVLNYVSDPAGRGEMLRRTTEFFTSELPPILSRAQSVEPEEGNVRFTPCLFLVLPAACVLNSRYFTEQRLDEIMSCLGYKMVQRKVTSKLIFYLWEYTPVEEGSGRKLVFRKEELNPGRTRNNFAVTMGC